MDFAPTPEWQPVEREAFAAWLAGLPAGEPLGMASGYTRHPVALYLSAATGGCWCLEVRREEVCFLNRSAPGHRFYSQAGWLLGFCWALKRGDGYREVTAADALAALAEVA